MVLAAIAFPAALACAPATEPPLLFCCRPDNDLYRVAARNGVHCRRCGTLAEAVTAGYTSAILVLADGYPEETVNLDRPALDEATAKGLRLYVEYPASFPGLEIGAPRGTQWERGVVSSGFFGEALPELSILAVHGCRYVPMNAARSHLVVARVAGYDRAVYGLPEARFPLLAEAPERKALVAATKLSHFVTGRYGPQAAWGAIWGRILQWLMQREGPVALEWTATVRPTYGERDALPDDAERQAFRRASRWFHRSKLLIDGSWVEAYARATQRGDVGLPPAADLRAGDGRFGILEGYGAQIRCDGSQPMQPSVRNDCVGECAMALAFDARVNGGPDSRRAAANLCDYSCFNSLIQQGIRADPLHPTFGLMSWGTTSYAWERAFYGDDNARSILGILAAGALLRSDRWDESMTRALLANLRTTGKLGFRGDRIDIPDLEANGWRFYHDREIGNPAPHYESYLWACYLWAYRATGHQPFLEAAESAIRTTMEGYPRRWVVTNGMTLDRARMLLCLAWLVRVADTREHRAWLTRVAEDLLGDQQPCGALQEELGDPGRGPVPPAVPSNEAYGTAETSLVQENGDPVCDMLYSANFAFLGLHEAAAATGDRSLREAEDRLAQFLCRIQVRSSAHPELDGAWFRAFDFRRWEYWGSSADIGWGVWSIESGWTQPWITAVLGMRLMGTSLWELTAGSRIGAGMEAVQKLMAANGGGPYVPRETPIEHLAVGARYALTTPPDSRHAGTEGELTDGRGWPAVAHGKWCGWEGPCLEATIDLGAAKELREAGGEFMRSIDIGICFPTRIHVSVSTDGVEFREAGVRAVEPQVPGERLVEGRVLTAPVRCRARYVRIKATPVGAMPEWHPAAGRTAWLFADELVVW